MRQIKPIPTALLYNLRLSVLLKFENAEIFHFTTLMLHHIQPIINESMNESEIIREEIVDIKIPVLNKYTITNVATNIDMSGQ